MKKHISCFGMFLIIVIIFIMSGCSKEHQEFESENSIKDSLYADTLSVDNDTFRLDEMIDLIGQGRKKADGVF